MKIGLIIPKFNAGGAEQVVLELAKQYKNIGHDVVIISMSMNGNMFSKFKESGITLKEFGINRQFRFSPGWFKDVLQAKKKIMQYLFEEKFDVIHTHLMGPDIDVLYPALKTKTKVIVHTIHNVYKQFRSKALLDIIRNWRRRRAYRKYNHVFAVDDEVKNWAIKCNILSPRHISTVKNGIDFSRLDVPLARDDIRSSNGWKRDEIIILNIGNLTKQKNQINLIRAVPLVLKKGINIRLVIAGDGPLRKHLENELQTLGLEDNVNILGYREDVPKLLRAADLFVFPSLWEGLPIALLEALACGIPVLASDVPIHQKILDNGNLGWLFAASSPEEISKGIFLAIKNRKTSERKSLASAEKIRQNYSSERMAKEYIDSYLEIKNNKRTEI